MVEALRRWRHRLAHRFGLPHGRVESWVVHGRILVGWRCMACRKVFYLHDVTERTAWRRR